MIHYVNLYLVLLSILWYSDTIDLYDLYDNCHCYHSWYSCYSMSMPGLISRQGENPDVFPLLIFPHRSTFWSFCTEATRRRSRFDAFVMYAMGTGQQAKPSATRVQCLVCNCATPAQPVCFSQDMFHHFSRFVSKNLWFLSSLFSSEWILSVWKTQFTSWKFFQFSAFP